ncbi:hypothetical protein ANCCEY_09363 [Ancylostoma ceylanicum]|uniref:Uncharacterized protein n=1 Tax=Ancylostoma ceylanicum TaxID=53326 RepID=A0A0D6LND0_9BILA|nr:hypothetical protein ANCCEY_09363 [Ancylostoma ceylanicum]
MTKEAASKPDDDEVEPADDDPDAIHYPPGRATLVGDVLRRPSVLEETSFNTDHLSPISDVSKAYTQRLTQLKSELGLDEMDGGAKEPRDEPPQPQEDGGSSSQPTFYSSEPDSSRPQQTGDDAEKRDDASEQKQDSSFDDWYDNPTVPPSEDSEVKDYVNELLNQSMDEAIFSASKSLKDKEEMKQEFLTREDSEVFFASDSPAGPAHDGDVTYVSSASVVMNDTHSSSEGDFDEDCIIKLVFSEKKEEAKPSDPGFLKDVPLERVQRTVKPPTVEEARATPDI